MSYRGMVVIENEDYGKGMKLVSCIAKKAKELIHVLGNAEMAERRHNEDFEDYDDDDDDMYPVDAMLRQGGRGKGKGSIMRGGRFGY